MFTTTNIANVGEKLTFQVVVRNQATNNLNMLFILTLDKGNGQWYLPIRKVRLELQDREMNYMALEDVLDFDLMMEYTNIRKRKKYITNLLKTDANNSRNENVTIVRDENLFVERKSHKILHAMNKEGLMRLFVKVKMNINRKNWTDKTWFLDHIIQFIETADAFEANSEPITRLSLINKATPQPDLLKSMPTLHHLKELYGVDPNLVELETIVTTLHFAKSKKLLDLAGYRENMSKIRDHDANEKDKIDAFLNIVSGYEVMDSIFTGGKESQFTDLENEAFHTINTILNYRVEGDGSAVEENFATYIALFLKGFKSPLIRRTLNPSEQYLRLCISWIKKCYLYTKLIQENIFGIKVELSKLDFPFYIVDEDESDDVNAKFLLSFKMLWFCIEPYLTYTLKENRNRDKKKIRTKYFNNLNLNLNKTLDDIGGSNNARNVTLMIRCFPVVFKKWRRVMQIRGKYKAPPSRLISRDLTHLSRFISGIFKAFSENKSGELQLGIYKISEATSRIVAENNFIYKDIVSNEQLNRQSKKHYLNKVGHVDLIKQYALMIQTLMGGGGGDDESAIIANYFDDYETALKISWSFESIGMRIGEIMRSHFVIIPFPKDCCREKESPVSYLETHYNLSRQLQKFGKKKIKANDFAVIIMFIHPKPNRHCIETKDVDSIFFTLNRRKCDKKQNIRTYILYETTPIASYEIRFPKRFGIMVKTYIISYWHMNSLKVNNNDRKQLMVNFYKGFTACELQTHKALIENTNVHSILVGKDEHHYIYPLFITSLLTHKTNTSIEKIQKLLGLEEKLLMRNIRPILINEYELIRDELIRIDLARSRLFDDRMKRDMTKNLHNKTMLTLSGHSDAVKKQHYENEYHETKDQHLLILIWDKVLDTYIHSLSSTFDAKMETIYTKVCTLLQQYENKKRFRSSERIANKRNRKMQRRL